MRDVAAVLRIRYPYLEAIEDGRYQDLPGIAYAVGFVRTYAEHLGLDADEVVRRFKVETENIERRTDLVFPSPIPERGTPGAAIVFVGILVAAVAYGAWYVGTSEESFFDGLVSPLPDRLATLLPDAEKDQPVAPAEETATSGDAAAPAPAVEPVASEPAPQSENMAATAPETAEQAPEQISEQASAPMEDQPQADAGMMASKVAATAPEPPMLPSAPEAQPPAAPEVAEIAETPVAPETEAPETIADATAEAPVEPLSESVAATAEPTPTAAEVVSSQAVEAQAPAATPESAITAIPVPVTEAPADTLPVAPVPIESAGPQLTGTPADGQAASASEPAVAEIIPPEAPQADTAQQQPSSEPVAEAAQIVESEAEETVETPVGGQQADGTAQQAALPDAVEAAETPNVAVPVEAAVAGGEARIVVRAKSDSWIQVRDGIARRLLVTRLLRAGDSYRVPNQPGLTLLTGNAGALDILVDGEAVDPIGTEGTVRRNVALDAERLQTGTAVLD